MQFKSSSLLLASIALSSTLGNCLARRNFNSNQQQQQDLQQLQFEEQFNTYENDYEMPSYYDEVGSNEEEDEESSGHHHQSSSTSHSSAVHHHHHKQKGHASNRESQEDDDDQQEEEEEQEDKKGEEEHGDKHSPPPPQPNASIPLDERAAHYQPEYPSSYRMVFKPDYRTGERKELEGQLEQFAIDKTLDALEYTSTTTTTTSQNEVKYEDLAYAESYDDNDRY